jgi:hypothetical protein
MPRKRAPVPRRKKSAQNRFVPPMWANGFRLLDEDLVALDWFVGMGPSPVDMTPDVARRHQRIARALDGRGCYIRLYLTDEHALPKVDRDLLGLDDDPSVRAWRLNKSCEELRNEYEHYVWNRADAVTGRLPTTDWIILTEDVLIAALSGSPHSKIIKQEGKLTVQCEPARHIVEDLFLNRACQSSFWGHIWLSGSVARRLAVKHFLELPQGRIKASSPDQLAAMFAGRGRLYSDRLRGPGRPSEVQNRCPPSLGTTPRVTRIFLK